MRVTPWAPTFARTSTWRSALRLAPRWLARLGLLVLFAHPACAATLGTSFLYQGRLSATNTLVSGTFDFRFTVYDAPANGGTVGGPVGFTGVCVTNGVFWVDLDFGPVFHGQASWLGVEVKTNGSAGFSQLLPLQPIQPAVQAFFALASGAAAYATNAGYVANAGYAATAGAAQSVPWSALPGSVLTNAISFATNATLGDSARVVEAGAETYGVNRFAWPNSEATFATNGCFRLWMVGNGLAARGEFGGVFTNLVATKPFAGYGSSAAFQGWLLPYAYGQFSGADTAVFHWGDDTNWHQNYFSLEQAGQITAPSQIVTSDIVTVSYLASPGAGSFVLEIRTNGANPASFLQVDSNWVAVKAVNARNAVRRGVVVGWTNTSPIPTQVRARAVSPGSTPILEFAQWDSRVQGGVVLGMYAHFDSGNFWTYTDPDIVFPIWQAQAPTMVLLSGGWGDPRAVDMAGTLNVLRRGFPSADIVDIATHVTDSQVSHAVETAYCLSNGIAFFDSQAASIAAWGSYANGASLGLYFDPGHLTVAGCRVFSDLLWPWLDLTGRLVPPWMSQGYQFDSNFQVQGNRVSLDPALLQVGGVTARGPITILNHSVTWQNPPGGTPSNPTAPAGWIAITNNGLRCYLPFYR